MSTIPVATSLDPLATAWLAGGLPRAVDAVLVSRLESRRITVVDGQVTDRGLDRSDRFDAALLDALGARGRRDVQTVLRRLQRDRRLATLHEALLAEGLLTRRSALGLRDRAGRPARTALGRRLLRELRSAPPRGGVWEVALHGRGALTDLGLRTALEPPARPPAPPAPRRIRSWSGRTTELHYAAGGTAAVGIGGGGFDGSDFGGGSGGDGGGGGGDGG